MLIRRRRNREGRAHTVIQVSALGLCFNHKVAFVFVSVLFERVRTVVHCGLSDQTNVTEISAPSEPSRLSFHKSGPSPDTRKIHKPNSISDLPFFFSHACSENKLNCQNV